MIGLLKKRILFPTECICLNISLILLNIIIRYESNNIVDWHHCEFEYFLCKS